MAERKRVGILISGRGSNMSALVAAAQAPGCPYEVALVFSHVADAPGLAIAEAATVPTASLDPRRTGGRALFRSEERRVGQARVRTCRPRMWPFLSKQQTQNIPAKLDNL